jgi:hypothetical protein
MGARNRVEMRLSYRPIKLLRLAESIPGHLIRLQIWAQPLLISFSCTFNPAVLFIQSLWWISNRSDPLVAFFRWRLYWWSICILSSLMTSCWPRKWPLCRILKHKMTYLYCPHEWHHTDLANDLCAGSSNRKWSIYIVLMNNIMLTSQMTSVQDPRTENDLSILSSWMTLC